MISATRAVSAALALMLAACGNAPDGADTNNADGTAVAPAVFAVQSVIKVGRAPHGMDWHNGKLYVANAGAANVGVVDVAAGRQIAAIAVDGVPLDVRWADDDTMLVTSFRDKLVYRMDARGTIVGCYELSDSPSLFSAGPKTPISVTAEFGDQLHLIDLAADTVRAVPTGKQPYPGHVTKDGVLAFLPNRADGTVTVYDLLNDRMAATVDACNKPEGGALTADEVAYVVACGGDNKVVFINTASFTVTAEISEGIGPRPFSVVSGPDGRYGFVNNAGGSTISVIDYAAQKTVQQIEVGQQPIVMRIFGRTLYVANEVSDDIHVIPLGPSSEPVGTAVNEVMVLGMLHSGHLTSAAYSLDVLDAALRRIKPDYVLTEMPPNRFAAAMQDWAEHGEIREPRIKRFDEYISVLFPLMADMDFTIIPTAGWNVAMNDYRRAALDRLSKDPTRAEDWAAYQAALATMNAALEAAGDSPDFIHSDAYDDIIRAGYGGPYDTLLGADLGTGGWTTINKAHYANIAAALDAHKGEGKRFVITYGAGHKYWFLDQLKQRADIQLVDPRPYFKE